jgi:hypothetical protein
VQSLHVEFLGNEIIVEIHVNTSVVPSTTDPL